MIHDQVEFISSNASLTGHLKIKYCKKKKKEKKLINRRPNNLSISIKTQNKKQEIQTDFLMVKAPMKNL